MNAMVGKVNVFAKVDPQTRRRLEVLS